MAMSLKRRLRKSLLENVIAGTLPGIYLRPERRSPIQFGSVYLGERCLRQAGKALEVALDRLYAAHGTSNIEWYVERSLGLDVQRRVAWCNIDITDVIVP